MAQLQGPIKIMLMAISVIFGSLLSAAVVAKADVHIPTRTEAEKLYEGEIDRSWADDIAPQASAEDSPLAETAVDGADALTQSEGSAPEAVPEKAASVRTGGWTAGLFSAKAAEVSKLSSQEDARRAIVGLEGRMTAGAA